MARDRVFVAIGCPARVANRIEAECAGLGALLRAFRTQPPASYHLTLAFLAERDPDEIRTAAAVMADVASRFSPFEISLAGIGFFPNIRHPNVVWIGVTKGAAEVTRLHDTLVEGIANALPFQNSPFHPHLTIGRWKSDRRSRSTRQRVGKPTPEELKGLESARLRIPTWTVDSIQLHTNQGRTPDGAYPILATAPLAAEALD